LQYKENSIRQGVRTLPTTNQLHIKRLYLVNLLSTFFTIAAQIIKATTEEPAKEKNPAAVALGRLGGLKGGKLTAKKRRAIAKKAAETRWRKKK